MSKCEHEAEELCLAETIDCIYEYAGIVLKPEKAEFISMAKPFN